MINLFAGNYHPSITKRKTVADGKVKEYAFAQLAMFVRCPRQVLCSVPAVPQQTNGTAFQRVNSRASGCGFGGA